MYEYIQEYEYAIHIYRNSIKDLKKLTADLEMKLYELEARSKFDSFDVRELGLSTRVVNCLVRYDYLTILDILRIDDYHVLNNFRNFGERSFYELIEKMTELGYGEWAEKIKKPYKKYS